MNRLVRGERGLVAQWVSAASLVQLALAFIQTV